MSVPVLGNFCHTRNAGYFCAKSNPRGPDSTLANAVGKRAWMSEEPESDQQLQFGRIQEVTGGGTEISTRELYGKALSFQFMATLCMGCNEEPDLGTVDSGFKNRLRKLPWTTVFVTDRARSFRLHRMFIWLSRLYLRRLIRLLYFLNIVKTIQWETPPIH